MKFFILFFLLSLGLNASAREISRPLAMFINTMGNQWTLSQEVAPDPEFGCYQSGMRLKLSKDFSEFGEKHGFPDTIQIDTPWGWGQRYDLNKVSATLIRDRYYMINTAITQKSADSKITLAETQTEYGRPYTSSLFEYDYKTETLVMEDKILFDHYSDDGTVEKRMDYRKCVYQLKH